jgi:DHA1 family tetracycline resistance protein-like MFS transporter
MLVMFLYWLAHAVYPSVWSFVSAYRYGWSEGQIGLSLGLFGICAAFVMGFILPKLVPVLGEWRTAVLGLCFSCLGLTGYAFAWQGWVVYAVILVTTIENVADPALRSIASAKVPPSAQGELQGAMTSLTSLTTIVGPAIFTLLFSAFTGENATMEFAGAPYMMAAIFMACAILVFLTRISRKTVAGPLEAELTHQIS